MAYETNLGVYVWQCPVCQNSNTTDFTRVEHPTCRDCQGAFEWEQLLTETQLDVAEAVLDYYYHGLA